MPHIHQEFGQNDHTVTAYIMRTDGTEPRGLMHMHRKLNKLMPIGGHVELDETPWQAIAHELREESGYDLEDLKILQPQERIRSFARAVLHPQPVNMDTHEFFTDEPGRHRHINTAYAFVADTAPAHKVGKGESQDLRWLSRNELDAVKPNDLFENNREVYRFIFETAIKNWEAVDTSDFVL